MKPKHIRAATRRVESRLTWQVNRIKTGHTLEIISDPRERVHTINWPVDETTPAGKVRDIEYLHELGHAYLAERVPVFCVHEFISREAPIRDLLPLLSGPIRATADWFVDDLVYQWAPEAELAEIREHVHYIRQGLARIPPDSEEIYGAALILAQGVHYLKTREASFPLAGTSVKREALKTSISCFLSIPPGKPSLANFSALFDSLLAPFGLSAIWQPAERAWLIKKR